MRPADQSARPFHQDNVAPSPGGSIGRGHGAASSGRTYGIESSGPDDATPTFEEDDVAPPACRVAPDPLLDADSAKAGSLVEGKAGHVLDLDAGHERPHAGRL